MNKTKMERFDPINIDVELLISLVEARPVIWDNTLVIYKDKIMRNKAWREICAILKDDYGEMDKTQRFEYGRSVLKKWTHLRERWCKDYRSRVNAKINGTIMKSRPYKYRKRMSYLKKIIETNMAVEDEESEQSEEESPRHDRRWSEDTSSFKIDNQVIQENTQNGNAEVIEIPTQNTTFEKQNNFEEEVKYLETEKNNEDNPHLHFFKSLLPFTAMLSPEEMLGFQGDVIRLLQGIIVRQRQTDIFSKVETE